MVAELTELKERNRLLLEYKLTGDQVKEELEETKQKIQEAEKEIERLKRPSFKRIAEQVIKKVFKSLKTATAGSRSFFYK